MKTKRRLKRLAGGSSFSVLELLVVCTVISMLAAMLMPAIRSAQERGKQIKCLNNLRQLGTAMNMHLAERRRYPLPGGANNFQSQLAPYLNESVDTNMAARLPSRYLCDQMAKRYPGMWAYGMNETVALDWYPASLPHYGLTTYGGYGNVVIDAAHIAEPSRKIAMVCSRGGNYWIQGTWDICTYVSDWAVFPEGIHNGKDNYLFCDGHVESIARSETTRINSGWFNCVKGTPYP